MDSGRHTESDVQAHRFLGVIGGSLSHASLLTPQAVDVTVEVVLCTGLDHSNSLRLRTGAEMNYRISENCGIPWY